MTRFAAPLLLTGLLTACSTPSLAGPNPKAARAAYDAMPISSLTSAPRRVTTKVRLTRPVAEVWAYLGNHQNLLEYSDGVLGKVTVDDSQADSPQGVGTARQCVTGDGKDRFVEKVVYYRAPYAFAYSAVENTWGLKDHLATVSLTPDGEGGTVVQWDQYFNHMMPEMTSKVATNIGGMLNGKILPFLAKKFGGEVLVARR